MLRNYNLIFILAKRFVRRWPFHFIFVDLVCDYGNKSTYGSFKVTMELALYRICYLFIMVDFKTVCRVADITKVVYYTCMSYCSCILIRSYVWSIAEETDRWSHYNYKANKFHVVVCLVNNRSQMSSKCVKKIGATLNERFVCLFFVLVLLKFWHHLWSVLLNRRTVI